MNKIQEAALSYIKYGLSVIPTKLINKRPVLKTWKPYQKRIPSVEEITKWFESPSLCTAVICGQVSGNLELLDFDAYGESYEQWCSLVKKEDPQLFEKLVIETSQNKGFHVIYRNETQIQGNQKLSQKGISVSGASEYEYKGKMYESRLYGGKWYIIPGLIETRGEGGYFLCAPSSGYSLIRNDFSKIPVISKDERDTLLDAARLLNEWIPEIFEKDKDVEKQGGRPGDDFNDRGDVKDILDRYGWKKTGRTGNVQGGSIAEHYLRPGKNRGQSASLIDGKTFYVFTSNGAPFDNEKAYSPFAVFALLEHSGNYSEAAKVLAQQGYGTQTFKQPQDTEWVSELLMGVKEKKRDSACRKLAGYYLSLFKSDYEQTKTILYGWNERNEPPLEKSEVDKIIDNISSRYKILKLSEIIGVNIYQIEIIERGVRDQDYLFYIEGANKPVPMNSKEVLSPSMFTCAIFELTKRAPVLVSYTSKKKHEWLEAITNAMTEATVIQTSIDETTDEPVIDAINHYISKSPSEDVDRLNSRAVVVNGLIMLKIKTIKNHMRGQGDNLTAKEIGAILRNQLKFTPDRVRVGDSQERVWVKPYNKWRW